MRRAVAAQISNKCEESSSSSDLQRGHLLAWESRKAYRSHDRRFHGERRRGKCGRESGADGGRESLQVEGAGSSAEPAARGTAVGTGLSPQP